jgi:hypothetical protein
LGVTSINVFRAALLSIVFTLAAGQNVALFCGVWCHSGEEMTGTCERQTETSSPGIVAHDDCTISGNAIVFVRDDARRGLSAPDVEGASLVPRFAFTPPATAIPLGYEPGSRLLLELRPLVLSLRI